MLDVACARATLDVACVGATLVVAGSAGGGVEGRE
jgi:hypothetical protein